MSNPPNFLSVVRMYRSEFEMSYADAKLRALSEFSKRGWPVPELFASKPTNNSPPLKLNE